MTITIENINEKAMKKIINECTDRVIYDSERVEEGLFTIENINEKAMKKIINECTDRVIYDSERVEEGLFTIILNENAIIKAMVDEVLIDLGGNKCFIDQNDFFTITIE